MLCYLPRRWIQRTQFRKLAGKHHPMINNSLLVLAFACIFIAFGVAFEYGNLLAAMLWIVGAMIAAGLYLWREK